MATIALASADGIRTLSLAHGPVNALRPDVVSELDAALDDAERDPAVRAVVLTGRGSFFSFGFDVPHLLGADRDDVVRFLEAFTSLYTRLFLFPKPTVAAINGHAVAGGWMLAQACDARVIAAGNVKVGLNEVRFGAALFAGSMAILRHLAGGRGADEIASGGAFLDPETARSMGVVDEICERGAVLDRATALVASRYGSVCAPAFAAIREVVRGPVVETYRDREADSIARFVEVWYLPSVQAALANILIR